MSILPCLLLAVLLGYPAAQAASAESTAPTKQPQTILTKDTPTAATSSKRRHLPRSEAKRWQRFGEIVKDEIKSATKKFLQERDTHLSLPLEVDIVLLGFQGNGAYHYDLDPQELEELLASTSVEDHCPTVWEGLLPSAMCCAVQFVIMRPVDEDQAIADVEALLQKHMVHEGDTYLDVPYSGWEKTSAQVYNIDAAQLEDDIDDLLLKWYIDDGVETGGASDHWSEQRLAIVVANPHKLRMSPLMAPGAGREAADKHHSFVEEWKNGDVDLHALVDQEGGYVYRYSYNGAGRAAAWVSRHNFYFVDVSAGPVHFGPRNAFGGEVLAADIPRLQPMLVRMAREVKDLNLAPGTLRTYMMKEASSGEHAIFMGRLASLLSNAALFLACPDVRTEKLEHAARTMVPIVVIQDHVRFDPLFEDDPELLGGRVIDVDRVQEALDEMMDQHADQEGVVTTARHFLHHHKQIAAALHKARVSVSEAVLVAPPDTGLHKSQHIAIDAALLIRELKDSADTLAAGLMDMANSNDYGEEWGIGVGPPPGRVLRSVRHGGTRVLPVFVLSLAEAPAGMAFDNKQLYAASQDCVVVLQLLGRELGGHAQQSHQLDTLHVIDGKAVHQDTAGSVTRNIIAGLATALAGMVPPYQRYDRSRGEVVSDWRFAVGAVPWGPYANHTGLSLMQAVVARRNLVLGNVEVMLGALQERLAAVDGFVEAHLAPPLAFITEEEEGASPRAPGSSLASKHRHWLDVLASKSHGYNDTLSPEVVSRLESLLANILKQLEGLSWQLFSRQYDAVEATLGSLLGDVNTFLDVTDHDLERAREVIECCAVQRASPAMGLYFGLFLFILLGVLFTLLALLALSQHKPGRAGKPNRDRMLPAWVELPR